MHTSLIKGQAADDGNCFLHSLKAVAGDLLAQTLNKPAEDVTPLDIRLHVASTVIGRLRVCLKGKAYEATMMSKHPYLANLSAWDPADGPMLDMKKPSDRIEFERVLGAHAKRCADLTPAQQTHIYNIARDGSWSAATGDTMAPATAAAFPRLRLRVITPETTPANVDHYTFGKSTAEPRLLFLENNHYVPATDPRAAKAGI